MRILIATYWYLPHVGGVNTYVNVLRKELIRAGHQVDVLAHHPDMDKYYMVHTGRYLTKAKIKQVVYDNVIKYYETSQPYVDPWVRWREIERYAYELAAVTFNLKGYDLIHTQDIISTRALWRVKPRHVPLVSTIHGLLATEHVIAGDVTSRRSIPWKYVCKEEYYGATSATKTIVPTAWLKRKLSGPNYGVPARILHTIPYGMDIGEFLQKYNAPTYSYVPPVPAGKTVLICPARLVPVKGHRYLLKALHMLKQRRNDFVCWLIGNGILYDELVAMAHSLGIMDVVHFLGDRNDVPQLMKKSDILVLPSVQDNHPFSIMEAQVAGKLVVASDAGGIPEMVSHNKTGFIFSSRNSEDLAAKLNTVLSNPFIRKQAAEQGRKWGMIRWAPSTLLDKTMKMYLAALGKE
ncbi:glycosyltransferase family 4 protein [Brevibacillus composti]|uniref:Glycosyltransferase family 4 protein n=1 Tax=Brevibacillus composti TaxID=2796470 RepID=A0A7T5EHE3_9BACL|nr:glycosyltransferase family 4 protein [Brevibacillus composti]QQE72667.1 glycosyltransferase family 4 protein [Brevibacillus composti]QUO39745.1 glycosyltransferase family 4 protein [Brevibacillus composti]